MPAIAPQRRPCRSHFACLYRLGFWTGRKVPDAIKLRGVEGHPGGADAQTHILRKLQQGNNPLQLNGLGRGSKFAHLEFVTKTHHHLPPAFSAFAGAKYPFCRREVPPIER
jgi:hypothetical protein